MTHQLHNRLLGQLTRYEEPKRQPIYEVVYHARRDWLFFGTPTIQPTGITAKLYAVVWATERNDQADACLALVGRFSR